MLHRWILLTKVACKRVFYLNFYWGIRNLDTNKTHLCSFIHLIGLNQIWLTSILFRTVTMLFYHLSLCPLSIFLSKPALLSCFNVVHILTKFPENWQMKKCVSIQCCANTRSWVPHHKHLVEPILKSGNIKPLQTRWCTFKWTKTMEIWHVCSFHVLIWRTLQCPHHASQICSGVWYVHSQVFQCANLKCA